MKIFNCMRTPWHILTIFVVLQLVQTQTTEEDMASSVADDATTSVMEEMTSAGMSMEDTTEAVTSVTAEEADDMTTDPGTDDTNMTTAAPMVDTSPAGSTGSGTGSGTRGGSAAMTTVAMPITCWACNDTSCGNSSAWQTCTTSSACSMTFQRSSKAMQMSCSSSCSGQFPNGQYTSSECGFCCNTKKCNNYTLTEVENACIKLAAAESWATTNEISFMAVLFLTMAQILQRLL